MLSNKYTDFALEIDTGTSAFIQGILDQSLDPGLQELLEGGSGFVYNMFGAIKSGAPAGKVSTTDIKRILDAVGVAGMTISDEALVTMYFMARANGATLSAADSGKHQSALISNGMLIPRTLSADHQGTAKLDLDIIATTDGVIDPITYTHNADLPAAIQAAGVYTLGPIKLNTTVVEGVSNVNLDFGLTANAEGRDSDIFPSFVSVEKIQPVLTVSTQHVDLAGTLTMEGKHYTSSQVVIYLRKRAEGGTFVADATAEHIKITLGKCLVFAGQISGEPKQMALRIVPWFTNGTPDVPPIAIATASAIV
jgi:hypothetical protein